MSISFCTNIGDNKYFDTLTSCQATREVENNQDYADGLADYDLFI